MKKLNKIGIVLETADYIAAVVSQLSFCLAYVFWRIKTLAIGLLIATNVVLLREQLR